MTRQQVEDAIAVARANVHPSPTGAQNCVIAYYQGCDALCDQIRVILNTLYPHDLNFPKADPAVGMEVVE